MGIKGTRFLTRAEAETKFRELWAEIEDHERGGASRVLADFLRNSDAAGSILTGLKDDDLAELLKALNDQAAVGRLGSWGGFDNYRIEEDAGG